MAQKETIEFVAKVDDQNNVVPTQKTSSDALPNAPQVPVDVNETLQNAVRDSLQSAIDQSIEREGSRRSQRQAARDAQLEELRAINESLEEFITLAGGGGMEPPEPPSGPTTSFFDDPDNRFDDDFDPFAESVKLQDAWEDVLRSFDNVDTGPSIDPQRFDETTEEFDKVFADMDAVEDTMAAFEESLTLSNAALLVFGPEVLAATKGLAIAVGAISGFVVTTQLYSSVLAATVENFGEFSEALSEAQAETERDRIQQQISFARELGPLLADIEENRNDLREGQRDFLANLIAAFGPWVTTITSAFESVYALLNLVMAAIWPITETAKEIASLLTLILKTITAILNVANPFKWFKSSDDDALKAWQSLTAPENVLDFGTNRNTNGRDRFDLDDLMKKNL